MHPLESKLAGVWPPEAWCDVSVVLAVSGGADSVALARAMIALQAAGPGRICAAHVNHGLRGRESDADEAFVVELCRGLGVPCEVGHVPVGELAAGSSDGVEAVARGARYDFIRQSAARLGARYVVTAHTADDQAETILHRIVRGTGIGGLSGMDRARPLGDACTLIRPLLGMRRGELTAYLDEVGQAYRVDSSNADTRYTRNRIRHEILPRLAADFNPAVVEALLRLGALAGEVQEVVERLVEDLSGECVVRDATGGVRIDATVVAGQPRYVVRELLIAAWREAGWPMQSMGFRQWDQLAEMLVGSAGPDTAARPKRVFPGNVTAEAREASLWLQRGAG